LFAAKDVAPLPITVIAGTATFVTCWPDESSTSSINCTCPVIEASGIQVNWTGATPPRGTVTPPCIAEPGVAAAFIEFASSTVSPEAS
jgi:hypothetical protein